MTTHRRGRALVVGVADYVGFRNLPDAVRNDVADLVELLTEPDRGAFDPASVTLLADGQATAAAIRGALAAAATSMRPEDVFLLYFSGHGDRADAGSGERSWLLPHDADPADPGAASLSSEELVALLDAIPSGRQVIMLDACHAGGIGTAKSGSAPKGFGMRGLDVLSTGAGRVLLSSSRSDQESIIVRGERNSVFTGALLEALNGAATDRGDGAIGVLDVFDYVTRQVPRRAEQNPVMRAEDVEGNFAIALRPATVAGKGGEADPPATAEIVAVLAALYPGGPMQDGFWTTAGGDASRIELSGAGRAQWHAAIRKVSMGGGGLRLDRLLVAALDEFPGNDGLLDLQRRLP
jgi:hypothetical protein